MNSAIEEVHLMTSKIVFGTTLVATLLLTASPVLADVPPQQEDYDGCYKKAVGDSCEGGKRTCIEGCLQASASVDASAVSLGDGGTCRGEVYLTCDGPAPRGCSVASPNGPFLGAVVVTLALAVSTMARRRRNRPGA